MRTAIIALLVTNSRQDGLPGQVGEDGRVNYGKEFFTDGLKTRPIFWAVARALRKFVPDDASFLDVGCGHGLLLQGLRDTGLTRTFGIEGSIEATEMWPEGWETSDAFQHMDLTAEDAPQRIPPTDFVATFEVAEHLPPAHADRFVSMLTMHKPRLVFFGAATEHQDQGMNPSHVNEQGTAYWAAKFAKAGYALDLAASAFLKHKMLGDEDVQQHFPRCWWYPKNALVFASLAHTTEDALEAARQRLAATTNLLSSDYTRLGYGLGVEFGQLWERDWTLFGQLVNGATAAAGKQSAASVFAQASALTGEGARQGFGADPVNKLDAIASKLDELFPTGFDGAQPAAKQPAAASRTASVVGKASRGGQQAVASEFDFVEDDDGSKDEV